MDNLKQMEKAGAGAIVLKSLFEEEIEIEMQNSMASMTSSSNIYPEIFDMFDLNTVEDTLSKYLSLISDAKKELNIPVIPSINCVTATEWTFFAKKIQDAGADALELNVFIMPSDTRLTTEEVEKTYFNIIKKVKQEISIPVALKVSYYFTNLAAMLQKLSETEIDGLVLFNKFFSPDFDIHDFRIVPANLYSDPSDLVISLRWIAIMAQRVKCDLAASTGVHSGKAAIKELLAGADAVQFASVLYKNGIEYIETMLNEIKEWMEEMGYETINDFRGKMSQAKSINPAVYERAQFMKHFSHKF
jgi:dihydroorotate dehydrogenase (fumarate)